jgi:DNA-binding beta-propeller fold protein YncE
MKSVVLSLAASAFAASFALAGAGTVFTSSNSAAGNAVIAFDRDVHGELVPRASYATGGLGLGSGLGSQGALAQSSDGEWLFVVNAGDDTVSVFRVWTDALVLTDVAPAQGSKPISVTNRHGRVYVLDAGGSGNLAGFTLTS